MKRTILSVAIAVAFFTDVALAAVTATNSGPGTVSSKKTFFGDIEITATPLAWGAEFDSWEVSGASNPCDNKYTICTIPKKSAASSSVKVTAKFRGGTGYLLLHGLASNADTWNDLVKARFNNSCEKIAAGTFASSSPKDSQKCFRINFGTGYQTGLEGISSWTNGDGSTYSSLGGEVVQALNEIKAKYPLISSVVLIGHSRGGLAARSALRNPSESVKKVKGILTIGTPHQGSALGRIYAWLKDNPRPPAGGSCTVKDSKGNVVKDIWGNPKKEYCTTTTGKMASEKDRAAAWKIADGLRSNLDVRAPSVNYLAIGSDELNSLSKKDGKQFNLPTALKYGAIISNNVRLGNLDWKVTDVLFSSYALGDMPKVTRDAILAGNTIESYNGDGIVHRASQIIPAPQKYSYLTNDLNVRHTEETAQTAGIQSVLTEMMK